jgi:hypothetical protein
MPPTAVLRPGRALASAVTVLAAALAVAGCGSSSGAGDTDPASLVPAGAPIYVEALVRPGDAQAADAQAALRKVLSTNDPGARLVALIDRAGREHGVTWARDIDPWLGERVGAAMLSTGGERDDGVVVAASSDDDRAADALAKLISDADERAYKDVAYRYSAKDKSAGAVLDGAMVIGSEPGLKAAIDAAKGSSLGESDRLGEARASVDDQRLGFLFIDTERLLRASLGAAGPGAQQSFAPFLDSLAQALPRTVAAGLDADPDALRVESAALGGQQGAPRADGSAALAALPDDAWLGIGIGDLGASLNHALEQISSAGGLGGVGLQALLGQVEQSIGLDVRRDLLDWMGGAGIFAAGTSKDSAGGGLIVSSKDPAATRRAVGRLEALARRDAGSDVARLDAAGVDEGFVIRASGDGHDIHVAAAGDRFVIAAGRQALSDAIRPGGTLGSSPALRDAAAKLGDEVKPSFFVDVERMRRLLASGKSPDRGMAKVAPFLDAFGAVAGGTRRDGDTTRGRAVATLP